MNCLLDEAPPFCVGFFDLLDRSDLVEVMQGGGTGPRSEKSMVGRVANHRVFPGVASFHECRQQQLPFLAVSGSVTICGDAIWGDVVFVRF